MAVLEEIIHDALIPLRIIDMPIKEAHDLTLAGLRKIEIGRDIMRHTIFLSLFPVTAGGMVVPIALDYIFGARSLDVVTVFNELRDVIKYGCFLIGASGLLLATGREIELVQRGENLSTNEKYHLNIIRSLRPLTYATAAAIGFLSEASSEFDTVANNSSIAMYSMIGSLMYVVDDQPSIWETFKENIKSQYKKTTSSFH